MAAPSVQTVAQAGVVGAGGAGFPTHVKLSGKADTVLINAAECEPLLHKDKEVLAEHTQEVLAGLAAAMAPGRRQARLRRHQGEIRGRYRPGLAPTCRPRSWRSRRCATRIRPGDEFVLVYDVLGRVIPPGGIPLHVGAVVMNVETAMNVAASPGRPVTEKFITVAGAVAEPCTLRVPVGVSLRQCVEAAGGATTPHAGVHGRRRDDGPAGTEPRRPGRPRPPGPSSCCRPTTSSCGATPRQWQQHGPHRPQRLRPVQLLHRAVPALPAGPPHRAAPGHAQPDVQPGRRGQRRRHGLLLRVQPVQPV